MRVLIITGYTPKLKISGFYGKIFLLVDNMYTIA
jgi:hypothetical protein